MAIDKISYTSKTTESIFRDLVSLIPELTDKWKNYAEDDPGIVLVKLMSYVGDMLSYNMDYQVNECFPQTAIQRRHAQMSYDLIGYKMHWYRGAECNVTFTLTRPSSATGELRITIPEFTTIISASNVPYTVLGNENILFLAENKDTVSVQSMAIQGVAKTIQVSRESITDSGRIYLNDYAIDEDESNNTDYPHIRLDIFNNDNTSAGQKWIKVDNLLSVTTEGKYFEFRVDKNDVPYLQLNDGWEEYISTNQYAVITYILTDGETGTVTDNVGFRFNSNIVGDDGITYNNFISIFNTRSGSGHNPETLAEASINAPREARTLGVAITLDDYDVLARKVDGIRACKALDQTLDCDKSFSSYNKSGNYDSTAHVYTLNLSSEILGYKVKPTTFSMSLDSVTYTDNGFGSLISSNTIVGSILYDSGLVKIPMDSSPSNLEASITCDFEYAPYSIILKLVTNDYGYITDLQSSLLQSKLDRNTVITVKAIQQLADIEPVPFNVCIHSYDPISNNVTNLLITESVNDVLYNYFDSSERDFGEKLRYPELMSLISTAHEKIEYADLDYPRKNIQISTLSYPMLGPVCVNFAGNPNYEYLMDNVIEEKNESVNAYDTIVKDLFGTNSIESTSSAIDYGHKVIINDNEKSLYLSSHLLTNQTFSLYNLTIVYNTISIEAGGGLATKITASYNTSTNNIVALNKEITEPITYSSSNDKVIFITPCSSITSFTLNGTLTYGSTTYSSFSYDSATSTIKSSTTTVADVDMENGTVTFKESINGNDFTSFVLGAFSNITYKINLGTIDVNTGCITLNNLITNIITSDRTSIEYKKYFNSNDGVINFSYILEDGGDINNYNKSHLTLPSILSTMVYDGSTNTMTFYNFRVTWWCSRPDLIYVDTSQVSLWGNISRSYITQPTLVTLYAILHYDSLYSEESQVCIVDYPIKITLAPNED